MYSMRTNFPEAGTRTRRHRTRRDNACAHCKAKKIRCNRINSDTCANCLDRALTCTTRQATSESRSDWPSIIDATSSDASSSPAQGLPVDTLEKTSTIYAISAPTHPRTSDTSGPAHVQDNDRHSQTHQEAELVCSQNSQHGSTIAQHVHSRMLDGCGSFKVSKSQAALLSPIITQDSVSVSVRGAYNDTIGRGTDGAYNNAPGTANISTVRSPLCEDNCISSTESTNWEYHGPRSCLSLCSQSGIEWVESITAADRYRQSAQKFTIDITRRLKLSGGSSSYRRSEADAATALKYTAAYFEHAIDASMGIIHRTSFETQLRSYLNGTSGEMDVAWHTLRHAICASGCRIYLSEITSFDNANKEAWSYFENALALHTHTLLFRTSLTSVQALTVMAYFCQNFGSPCLEYMLCNNALALALGKGLHRRPTSSWNLTTSESSLRCCLFWTLYCLEKQIERQSGRPSIINDDEVTCELPDISLQATSLRPVYLITLIKLSRFASLVSRRLSSIQVSRLEAQALIRLVVNLDEQLNILKAELEPTIMLGNPFNPNRPPSDMTFQQAVYLHCLYHTTELDIHNTLTYPWSQNLLKADSHPTIRSHVAASIDKVVTTCHTAMLTLNYVHIDATTPVPLSFFTPFYVLSNLFVCVLQDPLQPRTSLALSLMELATAFFTRLHVAAGTEIPMEHAKELTILARETVQKASTATVQTGASTDPDLSTLAQSEAEAGSLYNGDHPFAMSQQNEHGTFSQEQVAMEEWSILVPTDIDLDGIDFQTLTVPVSGHGFR